MESFVKRSFLLLLIVCSLLLSPAHMLGQRRASQPARTTAPRQTASAVARLPQAQLANRTLANGLEIIVLEDHSIPLITIELAVRNGSYTEPPELNGLSHLYEHMFFKTNRAVANQED